MTGLAYPAESLQEDGDPGGSALAVYLHWPYCLSKCPYCDFNSHVAARIDQERWRAALLAELDREAAALAGRTVHSVFFGGGTPSLMAPATLAAVLDRLALRFRLAADVEVTLEANPTSVEAARLVEFRAAGANRVSIGVQALDDDALRFLGRTHGAADALAAVDLAARLFPRFSFDLIYARPGQTPAAWAGELGRALERAGDHLSLYQLTIEPGTPFALQHARGAFATPDEDTAAALWEVTQELTEAAGLPAYEISNHARPGRACRHNLAYWHYRDYLGLGPGAHGRLTGPRGDRLATRNLKAPERWMAAVEGTGSGAHERVPLGRDARRDELLMMGLRLTAGVSRARFREEVGVALESGLDGRRLAALEEEGLVSLAGGRLAATATGRARLDAVLGYLLA